GSEAGHRKSGRGPTTSVPLPIFRPSCDPPPSQTRLPVNKHERSSSRWILRCFGDLGSCFRGTSGEDESGKRVRRAQSARGSFQSRMPPVRPWTLVKRLTFGGSSRLIFLALPPPM